MTPQEDLDAMARAIIDATGHGVYMSAVAARVAHAELESGTAPFSRRSQEVGGAEWTAADASLLPAD